MNPPEFAAVCSAGTLRGPLAPPLDARAAALSDRLAIGARIGRPDRHAAPPCHDLRRRRRRAHEPVRAPAPTDPSTRGSSLRRDVIDGGRSKPLDPIAAERAPSFGAGAPARRGLVMPNAEGPTCEEPSS